MSSEYNHKAGIAAVSEFAVVSGCFFGAVFIAMTSLRWFFFLASAVIVLLGILMLFVIYDSAARKDDSDYPP